MLGKRIINTATGAAPTPSCTTDTVQILDGVPLESIATYQLDGNATSIPNNTYPGTFTNPSYVTGKFGQAAEFNGSSSYIHASGLTIPNTTTISLWVKPSNTTTNGAVFSSQTSDYRREYPKLIWYPTSATYNGFAVIYTQNGGYISSSSVASANEWHHVVCIKNSNGSGSMYVDNVLIGSIGANTTHPQIAGFTYGCAYEPESGGFKEFFDGQIDQVRIFNTALDSGAITNLYNETVATASNSYISLPSCVAYYKMSDATDETGSYDGTPTNVNFNVAGKFGNAGEFNGSSSKIIIPTSTTNSIDSNGAFSVSFWFFANSGSLGSTERRMITLFDGLYIWIEIPANEFLRYRVINSSSTSIENTGTTTITENAWHHIVLTGDSTNGIIAYLNGSVEILSASWDGTFKNGSGSSRYDFNVFGGQEDNLGSLIRPFLGKLDQVRIFDRAITSDEVETLYDEVQCIPTIVPTDHFETVTYTGNGGTQKITGYIRKGAAFNGSSSKIAIPNVIDFSTGEHTISAWINTASTSVTRFISNFYSGTVPDGSIDFVWIPASNSINIDFPIGGTNYTNTITGLSTGTWYHIVATFVNNGTCTAYLNGSSVDTVVAPSFTATTYQDLNLGYFERNNNYWSGSIDQVRIFNKALDSGEVTTLYGETYASSTKSTTDIFGDGSGVALYELDEDANSSNFEQAVVFSQSTSLIELPSNIDDPLRSSGAFAVSCWINPSSGNGFGEFIHILNDIYLLLAFKSDNKIEARVYNSSEVGSIIISSSTFSLNSWYHVVWTGNSTNGVTLYVNNSQEGNTTWDGTFDTYPTAAYKHNLFGSNTLTGGSPYYGKLDDVRIYSDELTSTEVGYIYNNTTASIPTDNLVAHYKLDGDATDETGTYNGTETSVTYSAGVYGGTPTNVNFLGMAFQPDLVWIKPRSFADNHVLSDSVRGINKSLASNTTSAENSLGITSFDSNGFSLPSWGNVTSNGNTFVAWCWKAGGAASLNQNGSIDSQVSANQDAGFSVVKYVGTGATASVGHGLSAKPELVFIKKTSTTGSWVTFSDATGVFSFSFLNTTNAFVDYSSSMSWNSSVLNLNNGGDQNGSGATHIAYFFHSVDGYQKVGSYTGNSSTSGPIIECGFEPSFVMIKGSDGITNWSIYDNKRDTSNPRNHILWSNLSDAELVAYPDTDIDFNATSFQLKGTNGGINYTGSNYIYLAIA